MSGPFKMKGSPMARNFGIGGSPMMKGCAPGDPDCDKRFKINLPGTVVSRSLKKAGGWVSRCFKNVASDIKTNIKKRKRIRTAIKTEEKKKKGGKYYTTTPKFMTKHYTDE